MEIKNKIVELEERLKSYISKIEFPCIENTPFIVEVGAYTVGTDDNGVVILQNVQFPMQFSKTAINEIKAMKFSDCFNNPVQPKIYSKYEWYSKQIDSLKLTLNELRKLVV